MWTPDTSTSTSIVYEYTMRIAEGEYVVTEGALERSGKGTHTTTSGIRMSGEWKADALNGEGVLEFPSGARYEGLFANNQFHGRGKYTWADGSSYEGQFTENRCAAIPRTILIAISSGRLENVLNPIYVYICHLLPN